jgi:hypothetical protein
MSKRDKKILWTITQDELKALIDKILKNKFDV